MQPDDSGPERSSGESKNDSVNQWLTDPKVKTTMYRRWPIFLATIGLIIILLAAVGVYFGNNTQSISSERNAVVANHSPAPIVAKGPTKSQPSVTTGADFPTLYPGLSWNSPRDTEIIIRTRANDLLSANGYRTESVVLTVYPNDFLAYYVEELTAEGWTETENAGGLGGEWHGYFDGHRFIRFGVKTLSTNPLKYQAVVEHN